MICDKLSKKKLIGSIIALTIKLSYILHITGFLQDYGQMPIVY